MCVCVPVPTGLQEIHTHAHTHVPGECFTVNTLLIALLLEKKGIWCLLSKEKDCEEKGSEVRQDKIGY